MLSDLQIAQRAKIVPVVKIAKKIGIEERYLESYGKYKAKISLDILSRISGRPDAKYIDVRLPGGTSQELPEVHLR